MPSCACGGSDSSVHPRRRAPAPAEQEASTSRGREAFRIGMSQCNLGEPWRVQMNADIKAAAAEHPEIEMICKDAQNDTLKQRAHVEELVSAGVDLIL